MSDFVHQRHKPASQLDRPRELIVACAPMRSNVNLSTIARTASALAAQRLILCGNSSIVSKIGRDAGDQLPVSNHRTLGPVLERLKLDGYRAVGLEQTSGSQNLHHYTFYRRTVLVVGNERLGISDALLALLDDVVEIPVWGMPHSYNVASATNMALYEYGRQYPQG